MKSESPTHKVEEHTVEESNIVDDKLSVSAKKYEELNKSEGSLKSFF